MKRVSVGGMSEASYEISTLERIRDEGLGDYTVLCRAVARGGVVSGNSLLQGA